MYMPSTGLNGPDPPQLDLIERMFYLEGVAERVLHRFNRRYGGSRREVVLLRTETGCEVIARQGSAHGQEVAHYFNDHNDARAMLKRRLEPVPAELSNWAKMSQPMQRCDLPMAPPSQKPEGM